MDFSADGWTDAWSWGRYALALVALLTLWRAALLWLGGRETRAAGRKLHDALARGDLRRAGDLQIHRGLYLEASRIYERGGEFARAGRALLKHGDTRAAAIAFEKAGEYATAAPLFDAAGDAARASECRALGTANEPAARPVDPPLAAPPAERAPIELDLASSPAHVPTLAAPVALSPPQAAATSGGPRFELLAELGRGGMGVVHKARDHRLERLVALKFLPIDIDPTSPLVATFRREARAAASLSHPYIVTIYDVGEIDGRDFIAMELVEGTTLEHLLEEKGALPPLEAIEAMDGVLQAVELAHSKGVIHRDLKPANIMKTRTGIKVMDFGLAKFLGGTSAVGHTLIGGTPGYMPPEQLLGTADHRADIFALGAMFYELLTDVMPGTDDRPASSATGYPSPKDRVPAVPARLSDLVMRCLEHDRAERPQDVSAILAEIREVRTALKEAQDELRAFVLGGSTLRPPPTGAPVAPDRAKPGRAPPIPREDPTPSPTATSKAGD